MAPVERVINGLHVDSALFWRLPIGEPVSASQIRILWSKDLGKESCAAHRVNKQ